MSKIQILIANGAAGSGKDAIASNIQTELLKQNNIKVVRESFKGTLINYTAEAFNIDNNKFYDENNFYSRENKELPKEELSLTFLISKIYQFYENINQNLKPIINHIDYLSDLHKKIEDFKELYQIPEEQNELSPRLALIFISEYIMKPVYGNTVFGDAIASKINNIYEENKHIQDKIYVLITDSGFPDELKPINELINKNNKISSLIFSIYRDGAEYDPSKDSRVRLTNENLENAGVTNFKIIKVQNNDTLENVAKKTLKDIENIEHNSDQKKNMAQFITFGKTDKSPLYQLSEIFSLIMSERYNKIMVSNINMAKNNTIVDIIKDDCSNFDMENIKLINNFTTEISSMRVTPHLKRAINFTYDENLALNKFTKPQYLKNLIENTKDLDKYGKRNLSNSIYYFLKLKPKTDQILKIFNAALLVQTNSLLNQITKENKPELYRIISSLNSLAKNMKSELINIKGSDLDLYNQYKCINLKESSLEELINKLNNFKEKNKFLFDILTKNNDIDILKTNNGFELSFKNIPNNILNFFENESEITFEKLSPTSTEKIFLEVQNFENFTKEINSLKLLNLDKIQELMIVKIESQLNKFNNDPTLINYLNLSNSFDSTKQVILIGNTNYELEIEIKKIDQIIKQVKPIIKPNVNQQPHFRAEGYEIT